MSDRRESTFMVPIATHFFLTYIIRNIVRIDLYLYKKLSQSHLDANPKNVFLSK